MPRVVLNTKLFDERSEVYALFPGPRYRFYKAFVERGIGFLDFPGLHVPEDREHLRTEDFLHAMVRSEHAAYRGAAEQEIEEQPRWSTRRTFNANALHTLLYKAKKGEVVVMPSREKFGQIVVGEFVDEPGNELRVREPSIHGELNVAARRIKWLGRKASYRVTERLLKRLQTQNAFTILERTCRREVYGIAYPSFIYGGETNTGIRVDSPVYSPVVEQALGSIMSYVSGACEAIARDRLFEFQRETLATAGYQIQDHDYLPSLSSNINSPGTIRMRSDKTQPLVTIALMSLALASCDAQGAPGPMPDPQTVEIVLDHADEHADQCDIARGVENDVRATLSVMGYERWLELCRAVHYSRAEGQVTVPSEAQL